MIQRKKLCAGGQAGGSEFAIGAVYFAKKIAKLGGILFAGMGLDTGGDVHGVGANDTDSLVDVRRGKTACKNYGMRSGGAASDIPVGGAACAAKLAVFGRGVEQECRGRG